MHLRKTFNEKSFGHMLRDNFSYLAYLPKRLGEDPNDFWWLRCGPGSRWWTLQVLERRRCFFFFAMFSFRRPVLRQPLLWRVASRGHARAGGRRQTSTLQRRALISNTQACRWQTSDQPFGEEGLLSETRKHAGGRRRTSTLATR